MSRFAAVVCVALSACVGSMVRAPAQIPSDGVVDCTDSMATPLAAAAVGAVALGVALYAPIAAPQQTLDAGGIVWVPVFGILGIDELISAAEGASHARACRVAKRRGAEVAAAAARREMVPRDEANVRWKRVAAAARLDECPTVRVLDAEVRALDTDLHDTVFVRDVAIARCLGRAP